MFLWWIWAFFFRLNWWHKRSCQAWLGKDRRRTWENERAIYCVPTCFQSTFDLYLTFVNWMRPDCLCSPNDKRNKGMQAFWGKCFWSRKWLRFGAYIVSSYRQDSNSRHPQNRHPNNKLFKTKNVLQIEMPYKLHNK